MGQVLVWFATTTEGTEIREGEVMKCRFGSCHFTQSHLNKTPRNKTENC